MKKQTKKTLFLKKLTLAVLDNQLSAEELVLVNGGVDTAAGCIDTSPPATIGTVIRVLC